MGALTQVAATHIWGCVCGAAQLHA